MSPTNENAESHFREVVRRFIEAGRFPATRAILVAADTPGDKVEFGLSKKQTRWRVEEVEAAGYDWVASQKASRLIRPN